MNDAHVQVPRFEDSSYAAASCREFGHLAEHPDAPRKGRFLCVYCQQWFLPKDGRMKHKGAWDK